MRINNNLMAMNAYRQLGITNSAGAKAMEKLSSGLRINRAGDDAAGLAISEKMRGQIRGLTQASRNAQDGISLIQTAEGALNETHAILQRMRELAVQAATDTNTEVDRSEIQKEVNELIDEINRIAEQTQFNELNLLDGSFSGKKFHIGANEGQAITLDINLMGSVFVEATQDTDEEVYGVSNQTVLKDNDDEIVAVLVGESWYAVDDVESNGDSSNPALVAKQGAVALSVKQDGNTYLIENDGLGVGSLRVDDPNSSSTGGIMTNDSASAAITTIQKAIETVSAERSKLGAYQNRLEHTIRNLDTSAENLQASESRIRDVDMAKEMMEFTKNNILQQAATAMLAQANMAPSGVLQLLR
ncbi:MAG: flagellin [Caldicoprobacterales bacterium]